MKILWVCPFFLHPTDRGAQIRTLATLKELHKRHEVHFAALSKPGEPEGPARAGEYSTRHFFVEHSAPSRRSAAMIPQLLGSLFSPIPLAISRYASAPLRRRLNVLIETEKYDCIVCDFLAASPSLGDLTGTVLFQHNVETTIFRRHREQSHSPVTKAFFAMQSAKMEAYERKICQSARHVIAVSEVDATRIREMFGADHVSAVSTGVDLEYFAKQPGPVFASDMVFSGSMDWLPNVDAVEYFAGSVLPLIRAQLPDATFAIAGRSPDPRVFEAVKGVPGITITGRVDDIRPYLWGAKISVVPIRIGGGTRLKIYECMAAGLPVISTSVGAEGLQYSDGEDIVIADDPRAMASSCVRLLSDVALRAGISQNALDRTQRERSWEAVGRQFEAILAANSIPR